MYVTRSRAREERQFLATPSSPTSLVDQPPPSTFTKKHKARASTPPPPTKRAKKKTTSSRLQRKLPSGPGPWVLIVDFLDDRSLAVLRRTCRFLQEEMTLQGLTVSTLDKRASLYWTEFRLLEVPIRLFELFSHVRHVVLTPSCHTLFEWYVQVYAPPFQLSTYNTARTFFQSCLDACMEAHMNHWTYQINKLALEDESKEWRMPDPHGEAEGIWKKALAQITLEQHQLWEQRFTLTGRICKSPHTPNLYWALSSPTADYRDPMVTASPPSPTPGTPPPPSPWSRRLVWMVATWPSAADRRQSSHISYDPSHVNLTYWWRNQWHKLLPLRTFLVRVKRLLAALGNPTTCPSNVSLHTWVMETPVQVTLEAEAPWLLRLLDTTHLHPFACPLEGDTLLIQAHTLLELWVRWVQHPPFRIHTLDCRVNVSGWPTQLLLHGCHRSLTSLITSTYSQGRAVMKHIVQFPLLKSLTLHIRPYESYFYMREHQFTSTKFPTLTDVTLFYERKEEDDASTSSLSMHDVTRMEVSHWEQVTSYVPSIPLHRDLATVLRDMTLAEQEKDEQRWWDRRWTREALPSPPPTTRRSRTRRREVHPSTLSSTAAAAPSIPVTGPRPIFALVDMQSLSTLRVLTLHDFPWLELHPYSIGLPTHPFHLKLVMPLTFKASKRLGYVKSFQSWPAVTELTLVLPFVGIHMEWGWSDLQSLFQIACPYGLVPREPSSIEEATDLWMEEWDTVSLAGMFPSIHTLHLEGRAGPMDPSRPSILTPMGLCTNLLTSAFTHLPLLRCITTTVSISAFAIPWTCASQAYPGPAKVTLSPHQHPRKSMSSCRFNGLCSGRGECKGVQSRKRMRVIAAHPMGVSVAEVSEPGHMSGQMME